MITLNNYQDSDNLGFDGFGNEQDARELVKAMQAGQVTGRDTTDQLLTQEPLKAESLEKTLKLLEFRMKDIQLWNAMPKLPAYNTVEEFLQLESYGTDRGGFYNEGELSDVEDSKYRRRAELVKYIQVTGEVTYQAQLVRSYVDAMRKEVENKTMWVIRKANASMTKADSNIIPQEFNSLYKQHAAIGAGDANLYTNLDAWQDSDVVIDLRGGSLTQSLIEDAAINVDANYGNVDKLFAPPTVISGLVKDFFKDQRILMGGTGYDGTIGTNPKAISTSFGDVSLHQDKFMKNDLPKRTSDSATSLKAPNIPSALTAALSGADGQSRFAAVSTTEIAQSIGATWYGVSAVNRYGESAVKQIAAAVTTIAGQSVDLTVTDGGGAVPASGYVVYRGVVGGAAGDLMWPIFKVSAAELATGYDGGAAGKIRDRNRFIPNTESAFTTEMVDDVMSFKQLAPLSKLDLAILGMSRRFITFMFGTPQLYTPKKMVRFINVGPYVAA
jgi:hypothetical protein